MKHHTSPEFYLSQWGAPLCQMRKVHGKVAHNYKHPGGTGYHVDIYKTEGVPEENAHDLEVKFMSPLDNDASLALAQLLNGKDPTDPRYREAWAVFICSLLYRHHEVVELLKDHLSEMWSEATAALEPMWAKRRTSDDPLTFAEKARQTIGDQAGADASNMLAGLIKHERAVPDIMRMYWSVIDVAGATHELLTSDRPIVMPLGLGDPQAYISLPISPDKLFVAAYTDRFRQLPTASKSAIVRIMNKDVVRQAREFVWGSDHSQKAFVEKHIAALPDRVVLSDQQREQALKAARGETREPV